MQQKELANLLGVSPAIVSRHAKRGMPTDTLERAQRWRKRHLEPGRVKGNRFTPDHDPAPEPLPSLPEPLPLPSLPEVWPGVLDFEIEAAGGLVDAALARGNPYGAAIRTWQLRDLMRQDPGNACPRLSVRVWLALLSFVLREDSAIRHALDLRARLDPGEFGARVGGHWDADEVMLHACDFDDVAINGWPEYDDDEDDET